MQCRVLFWNQASNTVYDKITSMKFNLYTSALLPRLGCSSETFFIMKKPTHRAGRHFRTKLMSRYIGSSLNGRFDVRFEELVGVERWRLKSKKFLFFTNFHFALVKKFVGLLRTQF